MRVAAVLVSALIAVRAAAAQPPETPPPEHKHTKVIAAASVGAIHLAYATWSYFAWYRDRDTEAFHLEPGAAFGIGSYAGGADKLGHAWANNGMTGATTAVLTAAGWKRLPSRLVAAGLTEIAFTLTEIQDGYGYASIRTTWPRT